MHSLWFKMKDCYLKGFIFTSGLLSLYPELVRVLFFFFFSFSEQWWGRVSAASHLCYAVCKCSCKTSCRLNPGYEICVQSFSETAVSPVCLYSAKIAKAARVLPFNKEWRVHAQFSCTAKKLGGWIEWSAHAKCNTSFSPPAHPMLIQIKSRQKREDCCVSSQTALSIL